MPSTGPSKWAAAPGQGEGVCCYSPRPGWLRVYLPPNYFTAALLLEFIFFFSFFFFFFFFKAAPEAHGSSQARGLIGATAAGHIHSHSNARSEPHLRPIPQLTAAPEP